MKRMYPVIVGIHVTILGGFLFVEDAITQQTFGGTRAFLPAVLLWGGIFVTLVSVAWYALSDRE